MAKIYRVIQIKLNQFKKMSIWSLTDQQSVFKHYHSDNHFSEFLPTIQRQKSTGTDMKQNYVNVTFTLCILHACVSMRPFTLEFAQMHWVQFMCCEVNKSLLTGTD